MIIEKSEKLYKVTFRNYTNALHGCVSDLPENLIPAEVAKHDTSYIEVGSDSMIIRESDIEFFRQFGGGFETLEYVGNLFDKKEK